MSSRLLSLALCIAALPLSEAAAVPLPAASYTVDFNQSTVATAPGTYTQGGLFAEIANLPAPSIHVHLNGAGTSYAQLQYWFRVEGPTDGVEVPILVTGQVSANASNGLFAKDKIWGVTASLVALTYRGLLDTGLEAFDNKVAIVSCNAIAEGDIPMPPPIATCPGVVQDEDVALTVRTLTGSDNRIVLNAAANNQEAFAANFDALADPVLSFAPGFDSTGYRIVLSDEIGNSAPEPASGLLTSTALGLVLLRRPLSGSLRPRAARRSRAR